MHLFTGGVGLVSSPTDGSSGLRICTREPVRLTDVVETSYPGTQGWYGLQRIFPLEFFWAASQVSRTDLV
jgi:hypothetical protein